MKARVPSFSFIVPAYKAESFIAEAIKSRLQVLDSLQLPYELIVVVDGQSQATVDALAGVTNNNLKILHYIENKGKGFAVKFGMENANGDYIGYLDAGFDIDSSIIKNMAVAVRSGEYDAVIPSKWHPQSQLKYPFLRTLISKFYNMFARVLLSLPVSDTQVGAKLYSRELVRSVLPKILVKRFAFECEFLAVARNSGFTSFKEVPIILAHDEKSTVTFKDGLHSFWDTLAVFYRLRLRKYYNKPSEYHARVWKQELARIRLL